MLTIKNLSVTLSRTPIVRNVNLTLPPGRLIALLGPNGAGKTTFITTLAGLTKPSSGTVLHDDDDITRWATSDRVERGIVYLPQQAALFGALNVKENLRIVFDYHAYWRNKEESIFLSQENTLLERVGLKSHYDQPARTLSGGEKRKLEVVRALLMHPRILLCDEPFAGVDPKSITELTTLFTELTTTQHLAILLSDHNVEQLLAHADYVYLMLDGSIVAQGTSEQIRENEITRQRYLG